MAAARSLFRRSMRAAQACVDEHRAWAVSYVRLKFRDDARVRGSDTMLKRLLADGEEELTRMTGYLEASGRLKKAPLASRTVVPDSPVPKRWSVEEVGDWLSSLGLAEHASAFARERIDGQMLMEIDDEDLHAELGVSSRLQRKRILAGVASLRDQG